MGSLRIVAGRHRGRRIPIPRDADLRPTGERVREALFDILGPAVAGSAFLDAFSGTGAIGLEAWSRGASDVRLVDRDATRVRDALALAERWEPGQTVVRGAVRDLAATPSEPGPFDIVFVDPPYGRGLADAFLASLARSGGLAGGGRVVVERGRKEPVATVPPGWTLARSARYGDTCLDFLEPCPPCPG